MKTSISLNVEQIEIIMSALNSRAIDYFELAEKQTDEIGKEFYMGLRSKVHDTWSKFYDAKLRLERKGAE